MRLAFPSFFNAVRSLVAAGEAKQCVLPLPSGAPMVALNAGQLRQVVGGDDDQLPKGGWKAVAL